MYTYNMAVPDEVFIGFYSIFFFYSFTGHSIIHILPEISCKGMTKDDVPALLEKTQRIMQTEYDKLNAETYLAHKKID